MLLRQALEEVRRHLEDPSSWTQKAFARDEHGSITNSKDPKATCFCLSAVISRTVSSEDLKTEVRRVLQDSIYDITRGKHVSIVQFNDDPHTTHDKVMRLLEHARQAVGAK